MARKPSDGPQGPSAAGDLREPAEGAPSAPEAPALVRMHRTPEDASGGSLDADVHPDEVGNYAAAGWRIAAG